MSASVEIIGVNQEKLLENLPVQYAALKEKYKGSAQNISAHDLATMIITSMLILFNGL